MKQTENNEIKLRIGDMLFTWDDEKERINFRKHKVHFSVAASAFMDSYLLVESNSVDEYTGEERLDVIGSAITVNAERVVVNDNDIIRIISARKAEKSDILMGIDNVLVLVKTPEEREEMKASLIALMEMRDEDIDYSDIPPITDFSRFRPLKPVVDAMREHNRRLRLERERKEATTTE